MSSTTQRLRRQICSCFFLDSCFPFPPLAVMEFLDRVRALFPGADANYFLDVGDENLAIADLAGLGTIRNYLHNFRGFLIGNKYLDLHLVQKIDGVFRATVKFRVSLLA